MSSDLGLDPSDPLNLLLHNGVDDSTRNDSSPDWSHLTALWNNPEQDHVSNKPMYDYTSSSAPDHFTSMSMNVDMHSFGIEPNMLHYDPTKYQQQSFNELQYPYFSASPGDILSNQYPFTFQSALDQLPLDSPSSSSISSRSPSISSASPQPSSPGTRRLSVTSNSGQQATPSVSSAPSASQMTQETAEELAQRVRQTSGVMLAVPMAAHLGGRAIASNNPAPSTPVQTKLPIPRLPRQNSRANVKASSPGGASSYGSSSSAASTPPPSTPPPLSSVTAADQQTTSAIQMQINLSPDGMAPSAGQLNARPKTSHTTIERRYRTNLNARIQSLRMAVPALRVLEDRDSSEGKKIKRAVKGGVTVKGLPGATGIVTPGEGGAVIDVIDERGYVDGVKVARKCSKANVLGKAVEYIKVLKRREHRLRAEQTGLKMLVSGLVGGPALLREWEKEWRDRFGGEERDELDADEIANNEAEDEESDEDEEDEEGETGRKRKRGRVANANGPLKKTEKEKKSQQAPDSQPSSEAATAPDAPVKRKRGRPRKVPVSISTSSNMVPSQQSPVDQDVNMLITPQQQPYQNTGAQSQPQQYLLATFALFSFFNSPLTSYSNSHQTGGQRHRKGVVLNHPPLAYAPDIVHGLASAAEHHQASQVWGFGEYAQAFQLAVSILVLLSMIMSWLKVGVAPRRRSNSKSWLSSLRIGSKMGELKTPGGDGKLDWLKVGEQIVLEDGSSKSKGLSLYTCFQVSRAVLASKFSASPSDLCILSLVLHGTGSSIVNTLLRTRSRAVWNQARVSCASLLRKPGKHVHVYERLVFDSMDVDEAASRLCGVTPAQLGLDMAQALSPLGVLGGIIVRDRMKKHLATVFVMAAAAQEEGDSSKPLPAGDDDDDEREKTFLAASELGGSLAELGKISENLCRLVAGSRGRMISVNSDLSESLVNRAEEDEVASLILALVLYYRVFRSPEKGRESISSLSPGRYPTNDPVFLLKKTLGNRVFEEECIDGLEDARDSAVDLIVDIERTRRH